MFVDSKGNRYLKLPKGLARELHTKYSGCVGCTRHTTSLCGASGCAKGYVGARNNEALINFYFEPRGVDIYAEVEGIHLSLFT